MVVEVFEIDDHKLVTAFVVEPDEADPHRLGTDRVAFLFEEIEHILRVGTLATSALGPVRGPDVVVVLVATELRRHGYQPFATKPSQKLAVDAVRETLSGPESRALNMLLKGEGDAAIAAALALPEVGGVRDMFAVIAVKLGFADLEDLYVNLIRFEDEAI